MTVRRAIAAILATVTGTIVGTAALAVLAMAVSPWPSAMLIRRAFDRGGRETNAALAPLVPDDVDSLLDVRYDPDDAASILDVHRPARPDGGTRLPTIVWVHGGGWVSGSKDQVANYARILAGQGFVVVALDYHLAPGSRYPRPVHQVLTALAHLLAHADELDLDTSRVVLAGDSAGSQIAAQVAAAVTDPAYAAALGVEPALPREHLRAALLHCGAYDLELTGAPSRGGALFIEAVLWSYTGHRSTRNDPVTSLASVRRHVTPAFPPTYLSGGDADPLTPQGLAFAERLRELGVELVADFPVPGTGEVPLNHEFQFDLGGEAGRATFERSVAFLRSHTA